jgi:hypothetical protein
VSKNDAGKILINAAHTAADRTKKHCQKPTDLFKMPLIKGEFFILISCKSIEILSSRPLNTTSGTIGSACFIMVPDVIHKI